jgi:hypothetical protein
LKYSEVKKKLCHYLFLWELRHFELHPESLETKKRARYGLPMMDVGALNE